VDPLLSTQIGEFIVEERIGAGGMGVVYRASHPLIGKQVAIKVLRPELVSEQQVERLLIEGRAVNAIRHPGIIDIFGFGTLPDGRPYIIMELLRGYSLSALIRQSGRLDAGTTVRILDEMLAALGAAHRAGVVHRDLKPGNVFMAEAADGTHAVKLVDFGIAKLVQSQEGPTTLEGTLLGTPEFMAPEQIRGAPSSPSMDLYAVGIIAFQMLTGERPFKGEPFQVLFAHVEQPPPAPSSRARDIPPELDTLVLQLLAKDPALRLPSADAVRQALRRVPGAGLQPRTLTPGQPVPAYVPAPLTAVTEREPQTTQAATLRPPPGQERRPQWAAGLVLLAGLAGAGGAWRFWREETAQAPAEVATMTGQVRAEPLPPRTLQKVPEGSKPVVPSSEEARPSEQKHHAEPSVKAAAESGSLVAPASLPSSSGSNEEVDKPSAPEGSALKPPQASPPVPSPAPALKKASSLAAPMKESAQLPKAQLSSAQAQAQLQEQMQRLEDVRSKHSKLQERGAANSEITAELGWLTRLAGNLQSTTPFDPEAFKRLRDGITKVEAALDSQVPDKPARVNPGAERQSAGPQQAASPSSSESGERFRQGQLVRIIDAELELGKRAGGAAPDSTALEQLRQLRDYAERMKTDEERKRSSVEFKAWVSRYLPGWKPPR